MNHRDLLIEAPNLVVQTADWPPRNVAGITCASDLLRAVTTKLGQPAESGGAR